MFIVKIQLGPIVKAVNSRHLYIWGSLPIYVDNFIQDFNDFKQQTSLSKEQSRTRVKLSITVVMILRDILRY